MLSNADHRQQIAPSARVSPVITSLHVEAFTRDTRGVVAPHAQAQLVVRFGPSLRHGFDVYAMGARQRVHRKWIPAGHEALIVRLRLGAHEAVLGLPSHALAGRVVGIEELWGPSETRELHERIAVARTPVAAAAAVEQAIARRLATHPACCVHARVARAAAEKLEGGSVSSVARELGMSERNLRRVFHDAVGMSPKAYARLTRFERALSAAKEKRDWAQVAAASGYYDQAHLIAEFRAIAGVTPRALLRELSARG